MTVTDNDTAQPELREKFGKLMRSSLIAASKSGNPILDDYDQLVVVDKQIDDGDLTTGNLQLGSSNSLVYIIEK